MLQAATDEDLAFVQLMADIIARLDTIGLVLDPASPKGAALRAARTAVVRLTAAALDPPCAAPSRRAG